MHHVLWSDWSSIREHRTNKYLFCSSHILSFVAACPHGVWYRGLTPFPCLSVQFLADLFYINWSICSVEWRIFFIHYVNMYWYQLLKYISILSYFLSISTFLIAFKLIKIPCTSISHTATPILSNSYRVTLYVIKKNRICIWLNLKKMLLLWVHIDLWLQWACQCVFIYNLILSAQGGTGTGVL